MHVRFFRKHNWWVLGLCVLLWTITAQRAHGQDEGLILIPSTVEHVPGRDAFYEVTVLDERARLEESVEIIFPDTSIVQVQQVQPQGKDRLRLMVRVHEAARGLGSQPFFVRTTGTGTLLRQAALMVRGQRPELERIQVRFGSQVSDTLDLARVAGRSFDLILKGHHFYEGSRIVFEDSSSIKMSRVIDDATPDSLVIRMTVQGRPTRVHPLPFRVVHRYTDTQYEGFLPVRALPPRITEIQPARLRAGNSRERITVLGEWFAPGASVRIPEIPWSDVSTPTLSSGQLQFDARIPADARALTIIVENEDGQEARRVVQVSRDLQPANASVRNRHGRLYAGLSQRVEFRAEGDAAFEPRRQYVLQIEGLDPEYVQPQSEGIILADVLVPEEERSYNAAGRIERAFTLRSMDGAKEWSGLLDVYLAPRVVRQKPIVVRPGERITVPVSGIYLSEAELISDTGIVRSTRALTDQTLEVNLLARPDHQPGPFRIFLVRDNFRFQTIEARVEAWADPATYVSWGWNKPTRRSMTAWSEANEFLHTASNGQLVFTIDGENISPDSQPQRLHLEVRNNAINSVIHSERYVISPGENEAVLIDLEGKVEPEQTLKVSLSTPQDSTNFNLVRIVRSPRERWDIAAGASVVRVAFNGDVQVLNSVGIGATYALDQKNDLGLNMGGMFIGYEDRVVDFGVTSSITFFKRLTLGFGWNAFGPGARSTEGSLFERRGFMIVGGTFNLALP